MSCRVRQMQQAARLDDLSKNIPMGMQVVFLSLEGLGAIARLNSFEQTI